MTGAFLVRCVGLGLSCSWSKVPSLNWISEGRSISGKDVLGILCHLGGLWVDKQRPSNCLVLQKSLAYGRGPKTGAKKRIRVM